MRRLWKYLRYGRRTVTQTHTHTWPNGTRDRVVISVTSADPERDIQGVLDKLGVVSSPKREPEES